MARATIGIPRALLYHRYGALWQTFFERLGCETVLSPATNRAILQRGVALSVDETCLPLKVLLGHIDSLRGRADYILVPRVVSLRRDEDACVKLHAAYDIAANSVEGVDLLTYSVDVQKHRYEFVEMARLALRFTHDPIRIVSAYVAGKRAQAAEDLRRVDEQEARLHGDGLKVLVVGHGYNLDDEIVGGPLVRYLDRLGVTVLSSERTARAGLLELAREVSRDLYWTYNIEQLGALQRYRDRVDGIIFVVTFPCGPDSLVTELCARTISEPPILTVVLDELQAEAGLRTRLESFVDIIGTRRVATAAAAAREQEPSCAVG